ncbi:MAG TPA: hypothetical protein PKU88_08390 [Bacillota bacterium]|nr:hypothetical protein [Bacillota bacterium]HNT04257.1 hypothetical protein [Bacillota bacterium]HPA53531.1 hypothetical protein [Bacillota bacterium]HPX69331.1 hypothetical protein [Bacillota bacterium]HQA65689.1 hypothetical protein [Bacillota bacterium]
MNTIKPLYRIILPILILLSLLSFASCSPQKKPDLEKAQKEAEEKKPPDELDKLKDSIKKVEKALEAIHEENKKPMFMQQEKIEKQASEEGKKQEGEQGGQSGEQGGGGEGSSGGSESGGEQQKQQAQAPKLTPEQMKMKLEQEKYKKFESIKKDVLELHSAWNSYEAKAISDFAMQTTINDFESALNNLTKTVEAQDAYLSLLEINQLYKYLPDFYMLYESKVPPDLDRLRFAAKKIMLLSEKQNFTGANDVLLYFENIWMTARPKLKSENAEIVSKFEFAFADLKNAVIAKNDMIVEAKSEVLLKLVDEIEKKAEKSGK